MQCAQAFFMSFRYWEMGLRLASALTIVYFTSFPERVLAFEYERELASQHLEFIREAEIGEPRVAGVSSEGALQTVIPAEGMKFTVTATAYSSTTRETDGDPFTTASGTKTHLGTLATSGWLPLGTIVRIEGRIYTVEDLMNSRFAGQRIVDIWMNTPELATQFGVRALTLEIVRLP